MTRSSSSTSSSDRLISPEQNADVAPLRQLWTRRAEGRGPVIAVIASFAVLLAFDLALNAAISVPEDVKDYRPRGVRAYFEYGRSTEGKLRRMIGDTDETTRPIYQFGWRQPQTVADLPTKAEDAGPMIAIYGMSFTRHLAEAVNEVAPQATVRSVAAPAAPFSNALAMATWDMTRHDADAVVIGIQPDVTTYLHTMTGMTWSIDLSWPYTYPAYQLDDAGGLVAIEPTINSLDDLRAALKDPRQMRAFTDQLADHDVFYDPIVFNEGILDRFVCGRLLQRALAVRRLDAIRTDPSMHDERAVSLVRAMVAEFAESARKAGKRPVVFLISRAADPDELYTMLEPTLSEKNIDCLASHQVLDTSDRSVFLPDGHYTEASNRTLAETLLKMVGGQ